MLLKLSVQRLRKNSSMVLACHNYTYKHPIYKSDVGSEIDSKYNIHLSFIIVV